MASNYPKKKKTKRKGSGGESDRFGRPTKYQKKFCEQLVEHMAKGYSFETFGAEIKAGLSTIHAWRERHTEFQEAYDKGVIECQRWWERAGMAMATGQMTRVVKETTHPDGTKVVTREPTRGDSKVWALTMKNRFRYADRVHHTGLSGEGVKDPVDMTDEEIQRELEELEKAKKARGKK